MTSHRRKTVLGIMWSVLTGLGRAPITVLTQIILFRLLGPEIIGLGAMITTVLSFSDYTTELGIGAGIIRTRDITKAQINDLFLVNFYVSSGLALAFFFGAPLIANFFHEPVLIGFIRVVSTVPIIRAFGFTANAILTKNLDFKRLAVATWVSNVVGNLSTIGLVFLIGGLQALVAGYMISVVLKTMILLMFSRWAPRSLVPSFSRIKHILNFSIYVHLQKLLLYFMRNMDRLFIGHYLGSEAFGFYEAAKRIVWNLLEYVSRPIARVIFPALAEVQADLSRMKTGYIEAVRFMGLITFPALIGILFIAYDLIYLAVGGPWGEAVPVLRVLCLAGLVLSLETLVNPALHSLGKSLLSFLYVAVLSIFFLFSYMYAHRYGIKGIAVGFTAVSILVYPVIQSFINRFLNIRWSEFIQTVRTPLLACLFMAVVLRGTRLVWLKVFEAETLGILLVQVLTGFIVYAAFVRIADRSLYEKCFEILRMIRQKQP